MLGTSVGQRDEIARKRLREWQKSSGMTQAALGEAIGRNQAWVSRYFDGEFDADLETLEALAGVFGHTLSELLDLHDDEREAELLERFRALRPDARALALQVLKEWTPHVRTPAQLGAPADERSGAATNTAGRTRRQRRKAT